MLRVPLAFVALFVATAVATEAAEVARTRDGDRWLVSKTQNGDDWLITYDATRATGQAPAWAKSLPGGARPEVHDRPGIRSPT